MVDFFLFSDQYGLLFYIGFQRKVGSNNARWFNTKNAYTHPELWERSPGSYPLSYQCGALLYQENPKLVMAECFNKPYGYICQVGDGEVNDITRACEARTKIKKRFSSFSI